MVRPLCSSDMSPIMYLWAMLERSIHMQMPGCCEHLSGHSMVAQYLSSSFPTICGIKSMSSCCTSPREKGGIEDIFPPLAHFTTNCCYFHNKFTTSHCNYYNNSPVGISSKPKFINITKNNTKLIVLFYLTKQRNRVEQNLIKQALKWTKPTLKVTRPRRSSSSSCI